MLSERYYALSNSPSKERKDYEKAVDFYLGSVMPETLYCAYVADELVGAGLLSAPPFGEDPTSGHLAMIGVGEIGRDDAYAITQALNAHCLDAARQLKLRVQVEFPDHHIHQYRCIHTIPGTDLVEDLMLLDKGAPDRS